jgi:hypothetical protein
MAEKESVGLIDEVLAAPGTPIREESDFFSGVSRAFDLLVPPSWAENPSLRALENADRERKRLDLKSAVYEKLIQTGTYSTISPEEAVRTHLGLPPEDEEKK